MAIQTGVAKKLAVKKGVGTWGDMPSPLTGAKYMRRVSSDLNLVKDVYQSNEIRPDYQVSDMRHGKRSVSGSIDGELSPLTYQDFHAAALRKLFAAVQTDITSLSLTVAVASPATLPASYTVTRGSGDFTTTGIKVGCVVRVTVGASFTNTQILNNNLLVIAVTALVLTVVPLNGSNLLSVTGGSSETSASCTINSPGMKSYVPLTSHTDTYFDIEHVFSDITQSELYLGCKVNQLNVSLPPTGMATVKIDLLGKDVNLGTTAQFTTPSAATTTGVLAAVNGVVAVGGVPIALLTGLTLTLNNNMTSEAVVGSNAAPAIFPGTVAVSGQATVMFSNATMRDYFNNETEVSLCVAMSTGTTGTADFMSYSMPRVKFSGAGKDDGNKGLVMTMPFTALLPTTGGSGVMHEQTTLQVCDSAAV
jgi:hypothetical protein